MKILKIIVSGIFWVLILVLLVAPMGIIYRISQEEMKQYVTPEAPEFVETAVGEPVQVVRQDVAEYVKVSGTFVSDAYVFQELEYKKISDTRWLVGVGDEVRTGQVLGILGDQQILAQSDGILTEMNTYSTDPYLCIQLFTPIELSCRVDDTLLSILKKEGLKTREGEAITVTYISQRRNSDGTTDVRIRIDSDSYAYGQSLEALYILSGTVYRDTLVLPVDCVYQKTAGQNEPWYIRQVNENGMILGEMKVTVGYSNGDVICVSEIPEGIYCDSGYKAMLGG